MGGGLTLLDTAFVASLSNRGVSGGGGVIPPTPDIFWSKMNEGTGTTTVDSVGISNGTLQNGVSWTTGPNSNNALSFNGSSQYVDYGDNFNVGLTSFSISIWTNYSGTSNNFPCLLGKMGTDHGPQWGLIILGSTGPYFFITDSATSATAVGPTLNDGNWHMTTGVCDRVANTISIYIDGVFYTSSSITGIGTINTSDFLMVGGYIGATYYFGSADDARVYSYVLTSDQILAIYNAGAQ